MGPASTVLLLALVAEPAGLPLAEDPQVRGWVQDALAQRPELAGARERITAEGRRIPQAWAMPEPMLAVGIQNDGFRGLQLGVMPQSYVSLMLSQTLPSWGKRGLRAEAAQRQVEVADADLRRLELSVTAEVERATLDLLAVREELVVLGKLDALWLQAVGLAKVRYEGGEGAQSDLLRAQLERSRLAQRRFGLEAEQRRRLAVLNRLRGKPFEEPVAIARSLVELPDPVPGAPLPDGETSPELKRATAQAAQAGAATALARRELWPDVTLTAGLMARGALEPMWLTTVGVPLPVWAADRQLPAAEEGEALQREARAQGEAVRQQLALRQQERTLALGALIETNRLYRGGLLVQSEATVSSTVAQYQVGKVTFASVLEALAGYLTDYGGFLDSIARAQRLAIAIRELSLAPLDAAPESPVGAPLAAPSAETGM